MRYLFERRPSAYAALLLSVPAFATLAAAFVACSDSSPGSSATPSTTADAAASPANAQDCPTATTDGGSAGSSASSVLAAPVGTTANVKDVGHVFKPEQLPAPDVSIKAPAGFVVSKVAENLGNTRILAVASDGTIYVTRREQGDVLMLKVGQDGKASAPERVASRSGLHGIALFGGKAYLATPHEIFRADVQADGTFGPLEMIIHDLPDAGQHNTRTVQIGPDGAMYISIGSTCNECNEPNPENATILRATIDGEIARDLRLGTARYRRVGLAPKDWRCLWGVDNGMDWLGDDLQPEEVNKIERGKRYGWPYFFGNNLVNPHIDPPGGLTKAEWQKTSVPAVLGYTAHSAPMQMSFYDGSQFPAEYRGDAFVSMRGSWNRKPASGYEIVRVHFENGTAQSVTPFVTGFIAPEGEYGRPCGNAVAADGSLLFTDDRNGVIYRVAYTGTPNGAAASTVPAGPMNDQTAQGSVPLALARPETMTDGVLTVTSPAFANGSPIPAVYSAYEQNASPPLAWSGAPDTTKSYAIIMEDPDVAKPPMPVVHWVAWNIPAETTSLREGLQAQDLLTDPPGMRQGANSLGNIGYKGPRPPEGDPPHHYHLQMLALDSVLDMPASGADRDRILAAAKGHVVARGELVGTFARPAAPSRP